MELSKEDLEILEANINYVSYKRTIQYKSEYISHEMSANVNEMVGLEKTEIFIRNRTNWLLQQSMKRIDGIHDPVNNYVSKK